MDKELWFSELWLQKEADEADEQCDNIKKICFVPLEVHKTEKHCAREGAKNMDNTFEFLKRYLQKNADEIDEQWEYFKEKFVIPASIHVAELENNYLKAGRGKKMNEAWKNFSKKCIESYDALQTLEANGLIDEEEKAVHEHNLLVEILSIMKTEVDD